MLSLYFVIYYLIFNEIGVYEVINPSGRDDAGADLEFLDDRLKYRPSLPYRLIRRLIRRFHISFTKERISIMILKFVMEQQRWRRCRRRFRW